MNQIAMNFVMAQLKFPIIAIFFEATTTKTHENGILTFGLHFVIILCMTNSCLFTIMKSQLKLIKYYMAKKFRMSMILAVLLFCT